MIKSNDYILITDYNDDYYLKVGKVLEVTYDFDGYEMEYFVAFEYVHKRIEDNENSGILAMDNNDRLKKYKYDLPEKCKVLMFRE